MSNIFISYRRDDAAVEAQLIARQMRERYGEESVFFDIHSILKGVDFQKKIDASVSKCDVLLAVIGDRWIDAQFEEGERKGQRRLDDPEDFVRIEVASALKRDIPVIPVLIGKVSMSDLQNKLPSDLADLSKRNAAWVRPGSDLDNDLQALVVDVRKVANLKPLTPDELSLPTGVSVVPKGLRAFDEDDAGFFLSLLPGPRRDGGLPDSIYFWKSRIEETDADKTFKVGLLYGPSGCGKSSLVEAGLLPRLSDQVTPVCVDATATDTEKRLLAKLKKHCPYLSTEDSLRATLRRKGEIPAGKKVLIILDQFEQYLHSTPFDEQPPLIDALKECDGERLQCIVMVRTEFVDLATRFVQKLECRLADDHNYALVDLLDKRHAKRVLALFGQAFGQLPESGTFSKEQNSFLNQVISSLTKGDYVFCVRLALFAEMVKAKDWRPATLKSVGGAEGVGKAFLEENLSAKTAPLEARRHVTAAEKVLSVLLPESSTDIKGAMKSKQELLTQSGYGSRPADFEELLSILDTKLRLITPTEAVVVESEDGQPARAATGEKYYQLTHDYLVPSLREWLTQKQKESWRGRAELRLAERASIWSFRPEKRHLPTWWEHINIRLFTRRRNWDEAQRAMMKAAAKRHGQLAIALVVVLAVVGLAAYEVREHEQASSLVSELKLAPDAKAARKVIDQLSQHEGRVVPLLEREISQVAPIRERLLGQSTRKPSSDLTDHWKKHFEERAKYAAALLHLHHADKVWPLFQHRSDPTEQTYLIHQLDDLGADPNLFFDHIGVESDDSIRMALILCLGESDVPENAKEKMANELKELYENDPNPGIHGAVGWLLRKWKRHDAVKKIDNQLAREGRGKRNWRVSRTGLTMLEIPAGEFQMGSPDWDSEAKSKADEKPIHRVQISRFLLSQFEVTHEQYEVNPNWTTEYRTQPLKVSWFEAVAICNKLSELEDIAPYYLIEGESGQEISINESDGTGYRLPTEAEWEYACRAGTTTKWSCGDDDTELGEYATYKESVGMAHSVGLKKPNPFGLHGMHGMAMEWCADWFDESYYQTSPVKDPAGPKNGRYRVLRAGSLRKSGEGWDVRSANRSNAPPSNSGNEFRVARSID